MGEVTLPIGGLNVLLSLAILIISILMVAFFSSSEASLISVSKTPFWRWNGRWCTRSSSSASARCARL